MPEGATVASLDTHLLSSIGHYPIAKKMFIVIAIDNPTNLENSKFCKLYFSQYLILSHFLNFTNPMYVKMFFIFVLVLIVYFPFNTSQV